MSRVQGLPTNFRVVVEPRRLGNFGGISIPDSMAAGSPENIARQYQQRCRDIIEQINRHVDEVGRAEIEFDREGLCSHCGRIWTEEDAEYNGGCCDADEDAELARQAAVNGGAT